MKTSHQYTIKDIYAVSGIKFKVQTCNNLLNECCLRFNKRFKLFILSVLIVVNGFM